MQTDTALTAAIPNTAPDLTPVTRWADLFALLLAPETTARLLAPTSRDNTPVPVAEGDAADLMAITERDGGGRAVAAVVAALRPDLVVVDLDGCGDAVLGQLLGAAEDASAALVHLAASGSPDSFHAAWACPTEHSRAELLAAVAAVRAWAGLDARAVDLLDGGQGRGLRLPGSASFKAGGQHCQPVTPEGRPLSALAAAKRAEDALEVLENALSETATPETDTRSSGPALTEAGRFAEPNSHAAAEVPGLRAWRPRVMAEWQRAALDARPEPGQRSDAACRAAWALWCLGVRTWSEAERFYATRPAFKKWRRRADRGRGHWLRESQRWASYRGPVTDADAQLVQDWLTEAEGWTDAGAQAALVAVLELFGDGRGSQARPIAARDMSGWLGHSSPSAGWRALQGLVTRGVLVQVRAWADGPAHEAALYSLAAVPEVEYPPSGEHDSHTPPAAHPALVPAVVLHPVWTVVGQESRALWPLLGAEPVPAAALEGRRGDRSSRGRCGVLEALRRLAAAGLAERVGHGRGSGWVLGPRSLAEAALAVGAQMVRRAAAEVIAAERSVWHAACRRDRVAASAALAQVRAETRAALTGVRAWLRGVADQAASAVVSVVVPQPVSALVVMSAVGGGGPPPGTESEDSHG